MKKQDAKLTKAIKMIREARVLVSRGIEPKDIQWQAFNHRSGKFLAELMNGK